MKVIGLTGGIASGKTAVTRHLIELGATVIDADVIAREVLQVNQPAYHEVVEVFGSEVLEEDGEIDRRRLGAVVFGNERARQVLNKITHPRVLHRIQEHLEEMKAAGVPVVVVSVPLLVETGMDSMMDEVWVVATAPGVQVCRLMARDGFSREEAEARLKAQLPLAEKMRHADRIIDNNGPLSQTYEQVEKMWAETMRGGGQGETHH